MDEYIKKSEAVDVIVKYPYEIAGKTATAIKMIEDLPSAGVVPKSTVESIIYQNSQLEAENERLNVELKAMRCAAYSLKMHYEKAKSEVDEMLIGKANALAVKFILEDQEAYSKALIAEHDSKLASEIFAEIEREIVAALRSNYNAKQERVEKQIPDDFVSYMCEGKIAALRGIDDFIAELKKKYTEDK